ncbi:3-deoxy-manno-octulosonate cytidylyltransferase [anaerobic digester metagenome]
MKIGAVVQARTSSTRLPGKVLKELPMGSGVTVLEQVIRRLKQSEKMDEIVVATTEDEADNPIVEIARKENVKYFRGSLDNVLERYYLAARENHLDVVVRVTSDCPCIDPDIVGLLVEDHLEMGADYTSNSLIRTFPHGLDVEVVNFSALETAHNDASEPFEREHVTPYIYSTHQESFKINKVKAPEELQAPDIRITLDTEEDYCLLCAVFDYLYHDNEFFPASSIINLFRGKPWLNIINKKIIQKRVFNNLDDEIEAALEILDLQDLNDAKKFLEKAYFKSP